MRIARKPVYPGVAKRKAAHPGLGLDDGSDWPLVA